MFAPCSQFRFVLGRLHIRAYRFMSMSLQFILILYLSLRQPVEVKSMIQHPFKWVFQKSLEIKVWILASEFQLARLEETGVSGDAQVSEHIYLRVTTVIGIYPAGEKHWQFYCHVEKHWRQAVQKTDHFMLRSLVPLESPTT